MTLQYEVVQKVNASCSVKGKVLQVFFLCQVMLLPCFSMCGNLHIWTKNICLFEPNQPAQFDQFKAIRSSMNSMAMASPKYPKFYSL